jgi:hypothetical protein
MCRCVACSESSGIGCASNQYMESVCSASSMYDGRCKNCNLSCLNAGSSLAPTGQFKLIQCNGLTSSNLFCANCTQNCPMGEYVTKLCNGTTTKDTAECTLCTCPAGYYASNNTCTGNTTSNVLQCKPCRNVSSCQKGYYLSGECSTFSNTGCTPCRSKCRAAETEAQKCEDGKNRICLPDYGCFKDCADGFYEKMQCKPPNIKQVCMECTRCQPGFFVKRACSAKNDTECAR